MVITRFKAKSQLKLDSTGTQLELTLETFLRTIFNIPVRFCSYPLSCHDTSLQLYQYHIHPIVIYSSAVFDFDCSYYILL